MTQVRLFIIVLSLFFAASLAWANQDSDAQEALREEESTDYYDQWLNETVVYIISPEEREIFDNLLTAEEKEQFIEQFWRRRDTDPTTSFNEFKEEHYRRIAYANDHFKAGKSGWRTDRGRVYIMYGPPEQRELHPAGTVYTRPMSEGGGQTKTYPIEIWHYRNIEGLGGDVVLEFVDSDLSGDYKMALSPEEKDAMLYIPGAGQTYLEMMGAQSRADRIREMDLMRSTDSNQTGFKRERSFDRLETYFSIRNGTTVRNPEFERIVETRIQYDDLQYQTRLDHFWVFDNSYLAPVTFEIPNRELTFQGGGETQRSRVNFYGGVRNLAGEYVFQFEEELVVTTSSLKERTEGKSVYQKALPLDAGRYKLTLIVQDLATEKMGVQDSLLVIPDRSEQKLSSSPVVVAERISPPRDEEVLGEPFVTSSGFKVYPHVSSEITQAKVGLYVEFYDFAVDQASGLPDLQSKALLLSDSGSVLWQEDLSATGGLRIEEDRAYIAKYLYLDQFQPGTLKLRLEVTDRVSGQKLELSKRLDYRPSTAMASSAP